MPTATSLSGYTLFNLGPLTTTFTAPASCSTAAPVFVGYASESIPIHMNANSCNYAPPADCNPAGSAYRSIATSVNADTNPRDGWYVEYYSPGVVCPAGWATVGAAAKPNPTSFSMSGALNVTSVLPTRGFHRHGSNGTTTTELPEFFLPDLAAFVDALGPNETALACCPSNYTVDGARCLSTLAASAYTVTAGCGLEFPYTDVTAVTGTWTIDGATVTGAIDSVTGSLPISTDTFFTVAPSEATDYVGVVAVGATLLVHQASDTAKASASASANSAPRVAGLIRGNENTLVVACGCFVALVLGGLFVL